MDKIAPEPSKLLSHRLRGFDNHESTLLGLSRALNANVKHVEFDVRVTRDDKFVAYHDPMFIGDDGQYHKFRDHTLTELRQHRSLTDLATLESMVQEFSAKSNGAVKLHLDIKDQGFESAILDICKIHITLADFVFVSWIPAVLHEIHNIDKSCRLCFSHIPMWRFPALYKLTKKAMSEGRAERLYKHLPFTGERMDNAVGTLKIYFDDDGAPSKQTPTSDKIGFNHGHFVPRLLSGYILDDLKATEGYICIPAFLVSKTLVEKYHQLGIKVAAFSVRSLNEIHSLSRRADLDLYYVDNAEIFKKTTPV